MSIPSSKVGKPKLVALGLAALMALLCDVGGCKDPNPTFVFDSGTDGPKDAISDGAGGGDASGAAGAGGGSGGTTGSAGAGGAP
jgi:hypothetical protein